MDRTELITAALKSPRDFLYSGDYPLFDTWGISPFSVNRDSDLLEKSNWDIITGELTKKFPDTTAIENFSHWAAGWVEQLIFDTTHQGTVDAIMRWVDKLAEYPVADEEDWTSREFEDTLSNIEQEGDSLATESAPTEWPIQVYSWLSNNGYDSELWPADGGGAYPSKQSIELALIGLGYAAECLDCGEVLEHIHNRLCPGCTERIEQERGPGILWRTFEYAGQPVMVIQ